jgi:hypothetical protein
LAAEVWAALKEADSSRKKTRDDAEYLASLGMTNLGEIGIGRSWIKVEKGQGVQS